MTKASTPAEPDREILRRALAGARRHILAQLDGLDDEQLRRPVLPSGWSCLGLVRHLTLSDERYWFESIASGGGLDFWPDGENADWVVGPEEAAADVIAAYRAACSASDAFIAATALDTPPARPESWWEQAGLAFPDLRAVIVHVIAETATHAGHLDAVRELIDGRQYIAL
ncbi:MAG: DinB family protein [Dermatophilaceae bacterium]